MFENLFLRDLVDGRLSGNDVPGLQVSRETADAHHVLTIVGPSDDDAGVGAWKKWKIIESIIR